MIKRESLGEFFKQVRETKGLTLEEVALKTRIQPDYLKALEDENFGRLPDQVFAKGFVRTYARSLGLDEDDALKRFGESAGAFYDKLAEREQLREKQAVDERQRKTNRKVVLATVGVALLGFVLLFSREQPIVVSPSPTIMPEPPAVSAPVPPALVPTPSLEGAPGEELTVDSGTSRQIPSRESPSVPVEPVVPPVETASASAPLDGLSVGGNVAEGDPLVLALEATELSWVVVQVDGASPHEALLRPGERITWNAEERFTVTLGNAGGVRVELNGKQQGPFGPSGRVARDIVLTR